MLPSYLTSVDRAATVVTLAITASVTRRTAHTSTSTTVTAVFVSVVASTLLIAIATSTVTQSARDLARPTSATGTSPAVCLSRPTAGRAGLPFVHFITSWQTEQTMFIVFSCMLRKFNLGLTATQSCSD